jgi:hypothetical protein
MDIHRMTSGFIDRASDTHTHTHTHGVLYWFV